MTSLLLAAAVWISPLGSDTSGDGSQSGPFATLTKAVDSIAGAGTVYVLPGEYTSGVAASKVTDLKIQGVGNPTFRFGARLSPITRTPGRAHVLQAPVNLGGTPNWVWLHNVPDASTEIASSDRYALQDERQFRLPSTRIVKTVATTLAEALDELDSGGRLGCFWSTGTLYFTVPNDDTDAVVYASTDAGLFSGVAEVHSPAMRYGNVTLSGVRVLYGGVNLRDFKESTLSNVQIIGARNNGLDYCGFLDAYAVESGGNGSQSYNGDGANCHDYGRALFRRCYWHDNWDDGESGHEGVVVSAFSCVSEFNRGNGFIPAYGCQAYYSACTSRENAKAIAGHAATKFGGFTALDDPLRPYSSAVATVCETELCWSVRDKNGFTDNGGVRGGKQAFLTARQCVANASTFYGYDCAVAMGCYYSGTGPPRSTSTSVQALFLIQ